jgi:peptide/nickel transport system ATP-binding protein
MQAGRLVEIAPVDALFATPRHPYTNGLLAAMMRPDRPPSPAAERALGSPTVDVTTAAGTFVAAAVDAWPALDLAPPRLIEVAPGHLVLAHPMPVASVAETAG